MGTLQDNLGVAHGTAVEIVDLFEDLLDEHSIQIPDEDRTGDESEAAIYGITYGTLVGQITAILEDCIEGLKEGR